MLVQEQHLTVNGELKVAGDINADSDGVYITVNGNCYIDGEMGAIQLGGGSSGWLIIQGSLFVGVGDIILAQGVSFQSGSVECAGNFNAAADGINISIDGSCSIAAAIFSRRWHVWYLCGKGNSLFLWRLYISIGSQFSGR